MPSTNQQSLKENAAVSKQPTRKNRGRRSRKQTLNPGHHSCCWDKSSAHESLLASSRNSLTSEEFCKTSVIGFPAAGCFATPVKGRQRVNANSHNDVSNDASSPEAGGSPFRPLGATANRSRPPFLSPLYSPRKPRNARAARPVRAMMDIFLDSRARSDIEDESDDESIRDIGRRLGISKYMSTPESPTPPSSRASSRETDSIFSTPTRASKCFSPRRSPSRRPRFYLWRAQEDRESPLKLTASPRANKPWTLASQRDGFWRREAERLRSCAPKALLPSWHLGLTGQEGDEDTERLMTLADVSLTELELGMSELDLGPPEHQGFEVLGDRSTANW
ncbi:hypothetical protein BDM02DRAFT_950915 [Thelephora ganbajun]|uniref:Uncharacterized protein n=1 Tax=Thelephora ganbajun TaxID=370292 RepID=A0ACB6ZNP7_THEGA|nr:hypothetical protein BDM02DRAFT_950915 [Thelephora ganbajun]